MEYQEIEKQIARDKALTCAIRALTKNRTKSTVVVQKVLTKTDKQ